MGLSNGICTHLSSVRLIRILPSVENTIKDIRNCGLGQGREYSVLAVWPVLINVFPQRIFIFLPYKFMSEMFNKVVDFSPVMLHTARSERRKTMQQWEEAQITNNHDALVSRLVIRTHICHECVKPGPNCSSCPLCNWPMTTKGVGQ